MIFNVFIMIQEAHMPPGNELLPDNQKLSVLSSQ